MQTGEAVGFVHDIITFEFFQDLKGKYTSRATHNFMR
jgi:hypothetical protein